MGAGLCSAFDLDDELVDMKKLPSEYQKSMDKDENVIKEQEEKEEEELKRRQEEEEKRKAEEIARIEEEGRRQRQREEAERRKEEELRLQEEKAKKLAEEERRREEQRRIEEEARKAEEAKRREIEEKRQREKKKADRVALQNFFKACGGLTDVNEKKKNFGKYSYPLHIAVKQCNAEIVRILLENKADKTLTTSSGQTALDKAKKYNENESHSEVIRLLSQ